mmetsp:Transcript_81360/g.213603  ORF Transcript_81360/g.213603 Transcript_81360/m.213603 type:complete len:240 (+) Transcript_81360:52-771(+)
MRQRRLEGRGQHERGGPEGRGLQGPPGGRRGPGPAPAHPAPEGLLARGALQLQPEDERDDPRAAEHQLPGLLGLRRRVLALRDRQGGPRQGAPTREAHARPQGGQRHAARGRGGHHRGGEGAHPGAEQNLRGEGPAEHPDGRAAAQAGGRGGAAGRRGRQRTPGAAAAGPADIPQHVGHLRPASQLGPAEHQALPRGWHPRRDDHRRPARHGRRDRQARGHHVRESARGAGRPAVRGHA